MLVLVGEGWYASSITAALALSCTVTTKGNCKQIISHFPFVCLTHSSSTLQPDAQTIRRTRNPPLFAVDNDSALTICCVGLYFPSPNHHPGKVHRGHIQLQRMAFWIAVTSATTAPAAPPQPPAVSDYNVVFNAPSSNGSLYSFFSFPRCVAQAQAQALQQHYSSTSTAAAPALPARLEPA